MHMEYFVPEGYENSTVRVSAFIRTQAQYQILKEGVKEISNPNSKCRHAVPGVNEIEG